MRMIAGLDHAILLVSDLTAGETLARQAGFVTSPRGVHSPAMGTANTTMMFRDGTYLELMTVLERTPLNTRLADELAKREGITGLALKSDDAEAAAQAFQSKGISDGEAAHFSRPVVTPDGAREAAFTIARIDAAATPAAFTFVCQHHTPDLVWREELLEHPNGAFGLAEVVGVANDLDGMAAAWTKVVGSERVSQSRGRVEIEAAPARITWLSPLAFTERFGTTRIGHAPVLAAAVVRVLDLDRAIACLSAGDVPFARPVPGHIQLSAFCGAVLEFVAD